MVWFFLFGIFANDYVQKVISGTAKFIIKI